jgi:hypothetical protein
MVGTLIGLLEPSLLFSNTSIKAEATTIEIIKSVAQYNLGLCILSFSTPVSTDRKADKKAQG